MFLAVFAALNLTMLFPIAAFCAVAFGVYAVYELTAGSRSKSEERLDQLKDPRKHVSVTKNSGSAKEKVGKFLESTAPGLGKSLEPKTEKERNDLRQRLNHAGFRGETSPSIFSGLKIMLGLFGLFVGGGLMLLIAGPTLTAAFRAVIFGGIFFYLPELGLMIVSKMRRDKIFLGLPDALDLLVVCVEAGLGLDQAMRKVAEEMMKSNPVIATEFKLSNMQLQMGRTREEVLTELGARNGVDDLRALATIIVQADKFGSSIAGALRVQSDAMRTKRRHIAEEKAAKTAVKLIFPLVLFIFPGIFVVLVGPAAITMVNEMLPAFQNR